MRVPPHDFDPETGHGTLLADWQYSTPVRGHVAAVPHVVLGADGQLFIRAGYRWDFGSGLAIDTPEMVAASLAHDALYDLIAAEELPRDRKKDADWYFRRVLKDYGVGFFRRNYCYWAVRVFGGARG